MSGERARDQFVGLIWTYGPTMGPATARALADRFLDAGWRPAERTQKPQRQDSLDAQLRDLMRFAVQEGMYDAHDWLIGRLGGTP